MCWHVTTRRFSGPAAVILALALGVAAGAGINSPRPVAAQPSLPDLWVTIRTGVNQVEAGGSVIYTVTVTNDYVAIPGAAVLISVTGGTFTRIDPGDSGFSCPAGESGPTRATCRRGAMRAGEATRLTVHVAASIRSITLPSASGRPVISEKTPIQVEPYQITLTAMVGLTISLPESNTSNNTAKLITRIVQPDLAVSIVGGPNPVAGGAPLLYTVSVQNIGTANATGVKLKHTLPAGASSVKGEASQGSGLTCRVESGVVICTGGSIPAGGLGVIYIDTRAPLQTGSLVSTAVVDPDNTIANEASKINNSASVTITSLGPSDLKPIVSAKAWSGSGGGIYPWSYSGVTLRVKVRNQGTAPAPPTKLRIELLQPVARFFGDENCAVGFRVVDNTCTDSPHVSTPPCSRGGLGLDATCSIPSLPAGSETGDYIVNAGLMLADTNRRNVPVPFLIRADSDNTVPEGDENNNSISLTVIAP